MMKNILFPLVFIVVKNNPKINKKFTLQLPFKCYNRKDKNFRGAAYVKIKSN